MGLIKKKSNGKNTKKKENIHSNISVIELFRNWDILHKTSGNRNKYFYKIFIF